MENKAAAAAAESSSCGKRFDEALMDRVGKYVQHPPLEKMIEFNLDKIVCERARERKKINMFHVH